MSALFSQFSIPRTQSKARRLPLAGALLALCVLAGCTRLDAATTFNLVPDPADPTLITAVVEGGAARSLKAHLRGATSGPALDEVLYLSLEGADPPVPVLSRLEWRGETARLTPAVPLTRGKSYVAVLNMGRLAGSASEPLREAYRVPEDHSPSRSRVAAIYPNQSVLPANLLKFYVHFTEPMAEGKLFRYARLRDAQGKEILQAFREVELWDDDHRRVTLWINPGRTKQALGLSESLGAVLEPNKEYVLEIAKGLSDQLGRPLRSTFTHRFQTSGMDHEQPRVDDWKLVTPALGTREPLRVTFPAPLDHSLALDSIGV
ncbi:MAG: hypothetical protein ACO1SX_12155, partial [Actinomycetota bacterium]